jgi:hypothetical protein
VGVTDIPASFSPSNPIKKTIYTLRVNEYAPEICSLTMPLMQAYAEKIGADLVTITERLRPEWPITIEKFQVAPLSRARGDDWAIFMDADTLVNPECPDFTNFLPKDTVAHNGKDLANVRWKYDHYFRRDGRNYGSCTWLVIASDWTVEDLWRLPDQTPEEAFSNIYITVGEHNSGQCKRDHLIDDYTLSRNIARFGLKATTLVDICGELGWKNPDGRGANPHLFHLYSITEEEKIRRMLGILSTPQNTPAFPFGIKGEVIGSNAGPVLRTPKGQIIPAVGGGWALMDPDNAVELAKKWGIK